MKSAQTENYWRSIAEARSVADLTSAVSSNRDMASAALIQLLELLETVEPLVASRAIDQLQWLAIQIANEIGDHQVAAMLRAKSYLKSAMNALAAKDTEKAISSFSAAADLSLQARDVKQSIHTLHIATLFLLQLGQYERALEIVVRLLELIDSYGLDETPVRMALYEFLNITRFAPAKMSWVAAILRIRQGMESAGDLLIANAAACRLGVILIRLGAYEEGLEIFADVLLTVRRTGLKAADGEMTVLPEASYALLWQARAFDLCGRETEAEHSYRKHPAMQEKDDGHQRAELELRLAELLIENNRLQEALDLLESHTGSRITDTMH